MMQAEKELIEIIVAGDAPAFRFLVESYQRLVCHVVFRMVSNEADREELCQEVFVKVFQHLKNFNFQSKLSTWVARIAYNTCINYLKKKKALLYDDLAETGTDSPEEKALGFVEGVPGDLPAPDELAANREIRLFLHEAIGELPAQYRAILTLYHLDEMSYKEIGEIINLPEGTVKSYLFRARKLLKERMLEKYSAEELMP